MLLNYQSRELAPGLVVFLMNAWGYNANDWQKIFNYQ
tara:strand:- start:1557 stop:1667 length:111 start_codon:yes stop_codon:yes gene_type:complete